MGLVGRVGLVRGITASLLTSYVVLLASAPIIAAEQDGRVRGRVSDDGGRPVGGARISIGTLLRDAAVPQLLALPLSLRTDAEGRFEAAAVPPGEWYVRVEQDALPPGALESETPEYPVTYYPSTDDIVQARPVRVAAAATVTADVTLRRRAVFSAALHITPLPPPGQTPQLELFLDATEADRPRVVTPRIVEPGGIVRFRRLRPGRYFVFARLRDGAGSRAAAQPIVIADRSLDVAVSLAPTGRISGRVRAASPMDLAGLRVLAKLRDGAREVDDRDPDSAAVAVNGDFTIDHLFGQRALKVLGLPAGWRVTAVRRGGAAADGLLAVPAGGLIDGIELWVGPDTPPA